MLKFLNDDCSRFVAADQAGSALQPEPAVAGASAALHAVTQLRLHAHQAGRRPPGAEPEPPAAAAAAAPASYRALPRDLPQPARTHASAAGRQLYSRHAAASAAAATTTTASVLPVSSAVASTAPRPATSGSSNESPSSESSSK